MDITLVLAIMLVVAYGMEIIAKKIKIPSVLLLLITGIVLRVICDQLGVKQFSIIKVLPVVGTIGLILIVFEGGLELDYRREKKTLIGKSFLSALLGLLSTVGLLSIGLSYAFSISLRTALINSIPIGIISSAIAIPAAQLLKGDKKDFLIYESVFSDVLGIVAFNYVLQYEIFEWTLLLDILGEMILIILGCVSFCLLMLIMLRHNKHPVKYVMILASLILVYSIGKAAHLPSLLLVLVFGLVLNNIHLLQFSFLKRYCHYEHFSRDLKSLEQITQEGVFVIKTFFFVLLGYMMDLSTTISYHNIALALSILSIVYAVRWGVLKFINKGEMGGEFYLAPRGLITVLLFLYIPATLTLPFISLELLMLVVLLNSLLIPFAFFQKKEILEVT